MLNEFQPADASQHFRALALNPIIRIKDGRPFGERTDYPIRMTAEQIAFTYWHPSRFIIQQLRLTEEGIGEFNADGTYLGAFRSTEKRKLREPIGASVGGTTTMQYNPAVAASYRHVFGGYTMEPEAVCFADGNEGVWYLKVNFFVGVSKTPGSGIVSSNGDGEAVGTFSFMEKFYGTLYRQTSQQDYTIIGAHISINWAPWRFSPQP